MKLLLTVATTLALAFSVSAADQATFFKPGDRLQLQPTTPLQDSVVEITVIEFGPGSWVLAEYDRTFSKAGESGLKTEKAQIWINFAHIISAKKK
jgi:hypothetical protein